jgi:cytochrome c biogenesis protein CcmG/thiol:disulfide interchange protein DsbE
VAEGLTVVGVLTDDPPDEARAFVTKYGADWVTVIDPDKTIKTAYRVAARPQTYFVDRTGVIRSIQVGQLTDADFDRQFSRIAS